MPDMVQPPWMKGERNKFLPTITRTKKLSISSSGTTFCGVLTSLLEGKNTSTEFWWLECLRTIPMLPHGTDGLG